MSNVFSIILSLLMTVEIFPHSYLAKEQVLSVRIWDRFR